MKLGDSTTEATPVELIISDFYPHCSQAKTSLSNSVAQSSTDSPKLLSSEAKGRRGTLLRNPEVSRYSLGFSFAHKLFNAPSGVVAWD